MVPIPICPMIGVDWSYPALAKLVPGVNDLATLYPEVAKEADGWDPTSVTAGSGKRVSWQCKNGHTWVAVVQSRTPPTNAGCPFCSGRRALKGVNDLATLFPKIANEANGWDPSTVTTKSAKNVSWRCMQGHTWQATVKERTPPHSTGCPYCSGNKVLAGFNDLATLFPDLASQSEGWDPSTVSAGSRKKYSWRCDKGHTWSASVYSRTPPSNHGCPCCSGRQALPGFNDLATLYPEVALEADGWNPATVTAGSSQKLHWKCADGHRWNAVVCDRTPPKSSQCPFCSGKQVLRGFNDLATLYPDIASQAHGWDPGKVARKSPKKLPWRCDKGHVWYSIVSNRTPPQSTGCTVCLGKQVLVGFNDLATCHPEIAAQAEGWDPKTVTSKSGRKLNWRCENGHVWTAAVGSRTPPISSGCPYCINYGFKPGQPAWLYLQKRPGEQQLGITNNTERRFKEHSKYGWDSIDLAGPFPGEVVMKLEQKFKKWLRKEVGLVPGTTENWFTARLEVNSLAELKAVSGVETDLF
jgi:hypothetical protein